MKVVIEFYRTRDSDDARAMIWREAAEADDLDDAIACALALAKTLNMPQHADAMTITDAHGTALYSGPIEAHVFHKGRT